MLIEPGVETGRRLSSDFLNEIDGSGGDYLKMPAGGSRMPATAETVEKRQHFVKQDGSAGLQVRGPQDVRSLRDLLRERPDCRRRTSRC